MRVLMLIAFGLLAACAGPAADQGSVQRGTVQVADRAVPLPPGDWRVLGYRRDSRMDAIGGVAGDQAVLLVQEQAGRITGLVEVLATEPTTLPIDNWINVQQLLACRQDAQDVVPGLATGQGTRSFDCRRAARWSPARQDFTGPRSAFYQPILERRARDPQWAPQVMLFSAFARGDARGSVQVMYSFAEPAAAPAATSQRITTWMKAVDPLLAAGFRTGSTAPAPAF